MELTNYEKVGRLLELLRAELVPFVEREMRKVHGEQWIDEAQPKARGIRLRLDASGAVEWDIDALLRVIWENWYRVFGKGAIEDNRGIVGELRKVRVTFAHRKQPEPFDERDTLRVADNADRILRSIESPEAEKAEAIMQEVASSTWAPTRLRTAYRRSLALVESSGGNVRRSRPDGIYAPLHDHLRKNGRDEIRMTFTDLEGILGFPLPDSARKHPAWWANEDPDLTRHVHALAWLFADYRAQVDLINETVTFRAIGE